MSINYALSNEQSEFKRRFHDFCVEKIAPRAERIEKEISLLFENYLLLGELHFFGLTWPKRFGGQEKSFVDLILAWEELAIACPSTFLSCAIGSSVAGMALYQFGPEVWQVKFLKELSSGKKIGAMALSEPHSGSDLTNLQTTAQKSGAGYVLNGRKSFVTNGPIADLVIAMANDPTAPSPKRSSFFLIEKNTPGLIPGPALEKLGALGAPVSELTFQDCFIPKDNLIGTDGEESLYVSQIKSLLRLGFATYSLGIAQACLEESIVYAQKRMVRGKPIARFQEVSFKIADMQMLVDTGRLLLYRSSWMLDQRMDASLEISLAKLFLSEAATWCATTAVQIHGGYGFVKGYKVEKLYRDAKLGEIGGGTSEIQRQAIARNLLGEGYQ
ncbi:MAG: acyl-CoA dehydrogenase family protein [Thermodesulfobacteriota bacterium]